MSGPSNIVTFPGGAKPFAPARGTIHVIREEDGCWRVEHESASGGSWGNLGRFHADNRLEAIRCACSKLEEYSACNLQVADIDPPGTRQPPFVFQGGSIEF
jgi:hypothetical protein